ncbi:hypothetical protein HYX02_06805 [Candidatus Woesearchaeota archaeon]|nr:hypothetical protein [Candidatus Woesearchaeota archaeon]
MRNLIKRLKKRGWSKKEIEKAVEIIHNAKQLKTPGTRFLEKRIYWILFVVFIVANFAVSIALMPLLIALQGFTLYFAIIILGVVFGFLFELVIRSIEHLEKKHHMFLAILIPAVALTNVFVISRASNNLTAMLGLRNANNPAVIAIVYAASFVFPYVVYRFVLRVEYYSKQ